MEISSWSKLPPGIVLFEKLSRKEIRFREGRVLVLLLTFSAYACFHASRKPLSIVKGVLDPEISKKFSITADPPAVYFADPPSTQPTTPQGWVPFNGDRGKARLGEMDVAFLASYAIGMFYAGALGDRLELRKLLTFGMASSGACICFFGLGYLWDIHSFWYYFVIQVITGLLSSIGWPVVVAIVANWFGKTKKGLIMGIWNAHTSVGNIIGSIIAADTLQYGWGWSFLAPGLLIMMWALVVYCFLIADPAASGLSVLGEDQDQSVVLGEDERKVLLTRSQAEARTSTASMENDSCNNLVADMHPLPETSRIRNELCENLEEIQASEIKDAVQFFEAWSIPGVTSYAFCLFFVKLVAYTFLYWLPFYIRHTEIDGRYLSDKMAGYLSTVFDIGGVAGGIVAGHLADKYDVEALIAVIFMYCAVPSLYLFRSYGGRSVAHAVCLMTISGFLVNGPYALITTAVSADLGTHHSLQGNARALATVTAIIDGTGSIGAAVGPFLTGYVAMTSWTGVFIMLSISLLIAGLFLIKLLFIEVNEKLSLYKGLARIEEHELIEVLPQTDSGPKMSKVQTHH